MSRLARMLLRVCKPAMVALAIIPSVAMADAPHDIAGSQRLWLDGLDVNAADTGNGGGTNPVSGTQVTAWKDKSANGYVAGNAVDYGSTTHSYPTYAANSGVLFNGTSNILEVAGGIYPYNTAVTDSEILIVGTTQKTQYQYMVYAGPLLGSANHLGVRVPWGDGLITWNHGTTSSSGQVTASWSGTSSIYNQAYLYNFGSSQNGTQTILRDGVSQASVTGSTSYLPQAGHHQYIGAGHITTATYHAGTISEVIIYNRRLNAAERNILQSYLTAKYANPGGAGAAQKYTAAGSYRYHVGGIGQESDGALATGTSAGLTIANGTMLATGNYLLAGLDSLNPVTGSTIADVPTGFSGRSQRVWYMTRTGANAGTVTMAINLAQIQPGVAIPSGTQLALVYRNGTTGAFSVLNIATYAGTGTISFTTANPQTGYYTVAMGGPAIAAVMSNAIVYDGVNATNFKAIPGALVKETVTVTNSGYGSPNANSMVLIFPVPANTKLYVGDISEVGGGPMLFAQGTMGSGLSYAYTSLSSTADGLDFSKDSGATWTYVPTLDTQQTDSAITNVRVKTTGTFASGTSPNFPSFTLSYGLIVK